MADEYVLDISKEGFNALITEDENLAFSSRLPMWKEYMSGTGTLEVHASSPSADSDEVEIVHNLGYRPAFILFASDDWTIPPNAVQRRPNSHASFLLYMYGISSENSLKIKLVDSGITSHVTFTYKYFIMVDEAE